MTSRESISTLLTLFKGTRSIIGSHLTQRQTQICDFYKSSILTKQFRVHDEMWDELSQLAQESRAKESVAVRLSSSAAAGSKSAKDLGKRSFSTKASPPATENKNKNNLKQDRFAEMPTTKLQRLFQYGSLATSMSLNAASDGIKSVVNGQRTSLKQLAFSSKNVSLLGDRLKKMRGAALKVGQMLSIQDESFLPREISQLLQTVQNQSYFMPPRQLNRILTANFGDQWRANFKSFNETPIASASISQVHSAVLQSGEKVAVKIQYPGVKDSIDSDMDTLLALLSASALLPKGMYADKSIANAREELKWECDFIREAQAIKKFGELLADDSVFVVPKVYDHLTTKDIITMDYLEGEPITDLSRDDDQQQLKDWIGSEIMRLCLCEIAVFKFMQTDPNWGNFLYNSQTGKIELIDFGASRGFDDQFINNYVHCLTAGVNQDYEQVKLYSTKLGYLTGLETKEMTDAHVESIMVLGEPFRPTDSTYDFSKQDVTNRVKAKIGLMLRERLTPPPEETYSLHRKFSGVFLLCTRLQAKIKCHELFDKYFK